MKWHAKMPSSPTHYSPLYYFTTSHYLTAYLQHRGDRTHVKLTPTKTLTYYILPYTNLQHGGDRTHVKQTTGACAHGHRRPIQHEEDKLWPPADVGRWVGK